MTESNLSHTYGDLAAAIGDYLGDGRDDIADAQHWTTTQVETFDRLTQDGLRQFLFPPPLQAGIPAHEWRFLKSIVNTMTLAADIETDDDVTVTGVESGGTTTVTATGGTPFYASMVAASIVITDTGTFVVSGYTSSTVITVTGDATCSGKTFTMELDGVFQLPDDHGGILGNLVFTSQTYRDPVVIIGPGPVDTERQRYGADGRPQRAAIRPKAPTGITGQRFELVVTPRPDADYEVAYRYLPLLDKLTDTLKYGPGGMIHSQTLMASCLAAAEFYRHDAHGGHWQDFLTKLATSIAHDKRANAAEYFGYNANAENSPGRADYHNDGSIYITYGGVPT